VADFGFAAPTQGRTGTGFLHTFLGTLQFMAPEILQNQPYQGQQADLFALGVVLFLMETGRSPYTRARQEDKHYALICSNRPDLFFNSHGYHEFSPEFKDLFTNMV
jgi:serine/threonine protein kinase